MDIEQLKYPIGPFKAPSEITADHLESWISSIADFPKKMEDAVRGLTTELEWKYRPEGWNIAQVVHHCLDSHLNSLIRFKWVLTEEKPTVKPYFEDRWIHLADAQTLDLTDSLKMLDILHRKWVVLLNSLTSEQLKREFFHPDYEGALKLDFYIGNYAWHCNHHYAHVLQALEHKGAFG